MYWSGSYVTQARLEKSYMTTPYGSSPLSLLALPGVDVERLVYLSPEAPQVLTQLNADASTSSLTNVSSE